MKKTTTASCATIVALATFVLGHSLDMSALQYHLELTTDCWGEESSWSITDSEGTILYSQAPNTLNDLTTYDWDVELADGCYTFNMYDSYGDGMSGFSSCGANGNYTLTDGLGHTLVYMDVINFGFEATHEFCVPYIFTSELSDGIAAMEYYVDSDPGQGNGIPLTLPPVDGDFPTNINISFSADLTSLTPGFHSLYTRIKDQLGRWSIAERRTFYIIPNISQSVTAFQYFFNDDPGVNVVGNGGIIEISSSDSYNDVLAITLSETLSNDFHELYIRTRDENGRWSIAERRSFPLGECTNASLSDAVAWWSFTEEGETSADNVGIHDGVPVNGTTTDAYAGFDGADDYIGLPDSDDWAFGTEDFTIEFLASFSAPGGSLASPNDKLIGQSDGSGTAKKWTLALGSGQLFLRMSDGVTSQELVQSPFIPALNEWYHLALTRSADTLRTYIDGVPGGTQVVTGLSMPDVSSALTIGHVDWLLGGDPGFMSGKLDELTIYHRELSGTEILSIAEAGVAGKCKTLFISTPVLSDVLYGAPFSQTLEAEFEVPALTWSLVSGSLPTGVTFDASGILSGTPEEAGEFSFTVMVTDGDGATAQTDFVLHVLLSLPEPQFTIFKSGTSAVPGREMDYFILVENVGTVSDTISVGEIIDPWLILVYANPSGEILEYRPNNNTFDDATDIQPYLIQWEILLAPGESVVLNYRVKLESNFPLGVTIRGSACIDWWKAAQCLSTFTAASIALDASCLSAFVDDASSCENLFCVLAKAEVYYLCLVGGYATIYSNFFNCMIDARQECSTDEDTTKGPIDPNEKLVLAERYIQPGALLPYVIHFENIGTIEALDVFVVDTLDADLDDSSLNIISTEGASYDPITRVLRWDLYDINLLPDSSGYVMYTCRPYADAPSGTVIHNTAAIQFEVFDIFVTNETENIIDGIAPEGVMDELSAEVNYADFLISWSGTDAVGEIKSYTIFVSDDGGPYSIFTTTEDTSATFIGVNGHTYSFTCIAEDLAGNVEVQEPIAEATTFINATLNTYYEDSDDDGFGNADSTIAAYTSSVSGYVSDNTDCNDFDSLEHPGRAWYTDTDGDDYSDGTVTIQCTRPINGYAETELVATTGDCNDTNANVHPGAEDLCNQLDDDCDLVIDEDAFVSDFNHDGYVNVGDLLVFSSSFGCTSNCGVTDMNSDGVVNVSDLLIFSSQFGSVCP